MSQGFELTIGGARFVVLTSSAGAEGDRDDRWLSALTRAERDVAGAVIAGRSNAEIAAARGVSVRTVARQVTAIFRKLGVHSRMELIARAP